MSWPVAGIPTLDDVRAWSGVADRVLSDELLERILAAELEVQIAYCEWDGDGYPDPLAQALLRRCARAVAARGLPLGLTGFDGEYGTAYLPRLDVEIERYEAPYRITAIA